MNTADAVPGIGSVFISLLGILALLAVLAWAVRRLRGRGLLRPASDAGAISIIASRQLGLNSSLLIVEAQGCRFLVGSSRGGMVTIGRLTGDTEAP